MAKSDQAKEKPLDKGQAGKISFLWRIFSFLESGGDADRDKRRQLKEIAKQLKRQKHSRTLNESRGLVCDLRRRHRVRELVRNASS